MAEDIKNESRGVYRYQCKCGRLRRTITVEEAEAKGIDECFNYILLCDTCSKPAFRTKRFKKISNNPDKYLKEDEPENKESNTSSIDIAALLSALGASVEEEKAEEIIEEPISNEPIPNIEEPANNGFEEVKMTVNGVPEPEPIIPEIPPMDAPDPIPDFSDILINEKYTQNQKLEVLDNGLELFRISDPSLYFEPIQLNLYNPRCPKCNEYLHRKNKDSVARCPNCHSSYKIPKYHVFPMIVFDLNGTRYTIPTPNYKLHNIYCKKIIDE